MSQRTLALVLWWALGTRAGRRTHGTQADAALPSFRSTYKCTDDATPSLNHCNFTNLAYFRGQLLLVVDNTTAHAIPSIVPTSEHLPNIIKPVTEYARIADYVLPVTEVAKLW